MYDLTSCEPRYQRESLEVGGWKEFDYFTEVMGILERALTVPSWWMVVKENAVQTRGQTGAWRCQVGLEKLWKASITTATETNSQQQVEQDVTKRE